MIREKLARLIMIGWRGKGRLGHLLKDCPAGGILLLQPGSVADVTRFIRSLPKDLLVAADVENGLAQRCAGAVPHPSAMALGAAGDPRLAFGQGRAVGLACRKAGIDWAFAPVVDVNSNPQNPIINTRSFGGDPRLVARMGAAWIRGCQSAGVLACAKHFPGHGDTRADSHTHLPVVTASRARAWRRELPPFRAAVKAGVASVMTAHVAFPAFDGRRPATLSRPLVTGILRERLGFRGLVVTDSLTMAGIARHYDEGDAALQALLAGCDILLDPVDPAGLLDHLVRAVKRGDLPLGRVEESVARVLAAKRRLPAVRDVSERNIRRLVARRALTQLGGPLPDLTREPSLWILANDGADPATLKAFRTMVRRRFPKARFAGRGPFPCAVVAIFARVRMAKDRIRVPTALIASARREARRAGRTVVLLCGSPYVASALPKGWPVLLTYGDAPDSLEAALEALAGRLKPVGRLHIAL